MSTACLDATPGDRPAPGFVVCDGRTPVLPILYADLRAARCYSGRIVPGTPLHQLFRDEDGPTTLSRAHADLAKGGPVTLFLRPTCRLGADRAVALSLHRWSQGAGGGTRILCAFSSPQAGSEACASAKCRPAGPRVDLRVWLEEAEERLRFHLPGRVEVRLPQLAEPLWVAADSDALDEVVAHLLATPAPPDPWDYAVEIDVAPRGELRVGLRLGVVGAAPEAASLPTEMAARLAGDGRLDLQQQGKVVELCLPRAADPTAIS
ncbi:MAG: hypothetical protein ACOCYE_03820 [Pseudomonadota bacterium]